MKVNNIQSYDSFGNTNTNAKNSGNPSFKGALAINFWDAVARGGFAASFTVQDMTGTNIPRTYQALQRNKDMTGKNNYKAAAEVAIREFLTGPSMCVIPMIVLGISKKTAGTAAEVPLENIEMFSDQMKTVLKNNPRRGLSVQPDYAKNIKSEFYERMFALALDEDVAKNGVSDSAKELAGMLKEYDEAPKRGFFKQLLNKDIIDKTSGNKINTKDQIFNKIITKFSDIKKTRTTDYSSLLSSDMKGELKGRKSISSLVKDFSNFGNDVDKSMMEYAPKKGVIDHAPFSIDSFMEEFKTKRAGSKFITNILMVVATALFMINIPKLYTLYKTNPETDAFREEQKGVVNANQ
ncbi:MAG: hypothetical protein LUE64_05350 [Candidatus Gastranaerophilales bacterium]|nr:hypothetical protein [Candidatus Gastranaerophilales bacterium]